jgi:ribosomal protein S18 acetylase RimI-like enzyme
MSELRKPMSSRVIRLDPSHVDAYRTLMLQAYAQHPEAFSSSAAERTAMPLAWWAGRVAAGDDAHERVYGAFVEGALAGVAGLRFETGEKTGHKATLYGMYVPSACRQHGLGRALVQAVLTGATERAGTRLVQLTVTEGNESARRLYEACGFRAFGTEPLAVRVGDRFVAKVHMWRELAPVSAG